MSIEPPSEDGDETDELLLALAGRARTVEADQAASPWARLAQGSLDPERARELAAEDGSASPEELDRAVAYFQPMGEGEREELVDSLLGVLASQSEASESESEPESVPESEPEAEAEVISLADAREAPPEAPAAPAAANEAPGGATWWIPAGMIATAAAAIVLWVVWPPSDGLDPDSGDGRIAQVDVEAVPGFMLETDGGLKQVRGDDEGEPASEEPARYRRDTSFEWVLRPSEQVSGELDLRGFVFVGESPGLSLSLDRLAEISNSGSIRIAGKIGDLDLEPGRYTIALVVGRPGSMPSQAAEIADAGAQGEWQISRVTIVIED